ncbi:MAG: 4Fe-4S dicluster domain-containing protein [Candidatus Aminicenantes bacterium]|nr:4Fe-4S dicluster domain-containing protein [Candidatus Aminicenantes bacterium]
MIRVDLSRCTGCRRCETACAFFHTGRVNRHQARIRVVQFYEKGIDGPVVCVQCRERYCLKCPEKALSLGHDGQVIVSPTRCNLCGACEKNCPIGAVTIFEGFVYICDLCGGDPKCVQACTENAIIWDRAAVEEVSLAGHRSVGRSLNPGERRERFIQENAKSVRKDRESRNA